MPIENPDKMKVAEIRYKLATLGMDTKGKKPILLTRLKEALALKGSIFCVQYTKLSFD